MQTDHRHGPAARHHAARRRRRLRAGRDADHRELAQRRPADLAGDDHPGLRGGAPRHQAQVHPHRAGRIQRRAELQARRRLARATSSPAGRSTPRLELFEKGQLADLTDLAAMANFGDVAKSGWSTDDGAKTFCVPMASVHPRLHLQQGRLRGARARGAEDRGRVLRRARQDQGGRHLHPDGDGHQRPVGSRDHGLPEHRPELLEGRGGPPGADRGRAEADRPAWVAPFAHARQVEGLPRRRLRGADLSRQPEPLHPRPRRDLPGRLLGDRAVPRPDRGRLRDGRLPAAGARTRATPATSPTTSTSRSG